MPRRNNESARIALMSSVAALGAAAAVWYHSRKTDPQADSHEAFAAYLRDHLLGADAAIEMVDGLRTTLRGTAGEPLFDALHDLFRSDRRIVEAMLRNLGRFPQSAKRVAGRAGGVIGTLFNGERPGSLSLFRTIEALAIGVQGKRCLWRAAQELEPAISAPGHRRFADLEADAVVQWEMIERYRRSLVLRTFR